MNYQEVKSEIDILLKNNPKVKCKGFEESFDFLHFKTFYSLLDEPKYAVLQAKNNPEMNTSEDQWFLTFNQNGRMVVIDIADEDTICDELYQLMLVWVSGSRTIVTKKQNMFTKVKSKIGL